MCLWGRVPQFFQWRGRKEIWIKCFKRSIILFNPPSPSPVCAILNCNLFFCCIKKQTFHHLVQLGYSQDGPKNIMWSKCVFLTLLWLHGIFFFVAISSIKYSSYLTEVSNHKYRGRRLRAQLESTFPLFLPLVYELLSDWSVCCVAAPPAD